MHGIGDCPCFFLTDSFRHTVSIIKVQFTCLVNHELCLQRVRGEEIFFIFSRDISPLFSPQKVKKSVVRWVAEEVGVESSQPLLLNVIIISIVDCPLD